MMGYSVRDWAILIYSGPFWAVLGHSVLLSKCEENAGPRVEHRVCKLEFLQAGLEDLVAIYNRSA